MRQKLLSLNGYSCAAAVVALLGGLGLLAGCSGNSTISPPGPPTTAFSGDVYGGLQPVSGAMVVAYAAATTVGAAPTELGSAVTDSSGKFKITFSPSPATGEVIYATATGGDAGGGTNGAIGLMTVAGIQGNTLAPFAGTVSINELTTVAVTAALKKYITFADCSTITNNSQAGACLSLVGATGLSGMAATVNRLVDVETGQASAFLTDNSSTAGAPLTATLTKLNTLASVIAACVDSDGTSGACTDLFQATGGQPDTLMSAWLVARMPTLTAKARALYDLTPATPVFSPVLATVPGTMSAGFWTVGGKRYAYTATNNLAGFSLGRSGGALTEVTGSPFAASATSESVAVDPTGRYVYVANSGGDNISAYTIGAGGSLTPIAGSPFAAGTHPQSVAVDPTGRYLYVTNTFGFNVSAYTIGAGGALTPIAGSPFAAGSYPQSVAVDPTGRYLYVANLGSNNVSAYTIGAGGTLTPIAGSPFAAGANPQSVTVDPTGRYMYVANSGSNNVSVYTIGAGGALTAVAGSSCYPGGPDNCFAAGLSPYSVTVDPTGRYVYVANFSNPGTVSAFTISAGGALAPIAGSPFAAGANSASVTVDPTGRYVYVANRAGNDVLVYTIGAGGALTPIAGQPVGANPASVTTDPTGRYVYVADLGGNVSAYTIGTGGAFTPIAGSPFAPFTNPISVAVDPTGRYVYAANSGGDDVSAYTIGSGGALTPVAGSPFAAGSDPVSVAVDPTGHYVFVVNEGCSTCSFGTVSAYLIGASGTLTPLAGSPFAAGASPTSVAVDPTGHYAYVTNTSNPGSSSNAVSAYTIAAGGTLMPISGSPFAAGFSPLSVAVDPTGRFVYVANGADDNVSAYMIGAGGTLTPIAGSPFAAGSYPHSVAVDPTGHYVFVANAISNNVSAYAIGAGGALTPVSGSPFATGSFPRSVAVGPTGRYVYVANYNDGTVSAYRIGAGGALTPIDGSPFAAGSNPASIAIGP